MSINDCRVRTHKERIKCAKDYFKTRRKDIRVSFIALGAVAKFYLLEDLLKLCRVRLSELCNSENESDTKNLNAYAEIIYFLKDSIVIARSCSMSADFKRVWKNINEHALTVSAKSDKRLNYLYKITEDTYKKFCNVLVEMSKERVSVETKLDLYRAREEELPIAVQEIIEEAKHKKID